jgi:ketosteroid isomerase-like protein
MRAAEATTEQEEFVRFFAEGWALGAGEEFFDHFGSRKHPDVVLEQPLMPTARGERGMRAMFGPLFAAMPDLRGEVVRWGPTEDSVLIELKLSGTVGGRAVEWTVVDRIVLEDGLIRSRRSFFDPLPLLPALLRSPRTALRLLPALFRKESR